MTKFTTNKKKRINTAEDVQKKVSSYNLGGNANDEATMENSTKIP